MAGEKMKEEEEKKDKDGQREGGEKVERWVQVKEDVEKEVEEGA